MNCREFELGVLFLARNQIMDAVAREEGLAHAENCVRCAGRLAAERAWLAGVAAVVSEVNREETPTRVEAVLVTAFRAQVSHDGRAAIAAGVPATIRTHNWLNWRLVAAAAMILIVISIMVILRSDSNPKKLEAQAPLPGVVVQPAPRRTQDPAGNNGGQETGQYLSNGAVPKRVRSRAWRAKAKAPEVVTEFYPMTEGEDLDDLDLLHDVQIVRVELPASALAAAGLSLGLEGSTQPVKADVVLGYDGLARAIRFVH